MSFSWPDELIFELTKDQPDYDLIRALIIKAYESHTGNRINEKDLNQESAAELLRWFNLNAREADHAFFKYPRLMVPAFNLCLTDKISRLSQFHCPICAAHLFPVEIIPIRISPESKQVLAKKPRLRRAFERAIEHRFRDRDASFGPDDHLCVLLLFVLSNQRRGKDVDNMAKALLDALKGVIFGDDDLIDHLNLLRIRWAGDEEFVYVNIRKTEINHHHDVLIEGMHHSWAGAERLELADFLDDD